MSPNATWQMPPYNQNFTTKKSKVNSFCKNFSKNFNFYQDERAKKWKNVDKFFILTLGRMGLY